MCHLLSLSLTLTLCVWAITLNKWDPVSTKCNERANKWATEKRKCHQKIKCTLIGLQSNTDVIHQCDSLIRQKSTLTHTFTISNGWKRAHNNCQANVINGDHMHFKSLKFALEQKSTHTHNPHVSTNRFEPEMRKVRTSFNRFGLETREWEKHVISLTIKTFFIWFLINGSVWTGAKLKLTISSNSN